MRFLPREEKFFIDFIQQASLINEAAIVLRDGVFAGNPSVMEAATRIRSLEQKGDECIHDIFTRLNSTFITPLDPEDIHELASMLDDVLDGLEEASHCLVAYRVEPIPESVKELSVIIVACGQKIEKMFLALSKDKQLMEHCIELNRLENMGDELFRKAKADLYTNENDPITVMKLVEIYETLEWIIDRAEDIADVIQGVVVKNS